MAGLHQRHLLTDHDPRRRAALTEAGIALALAAAAGLLYFPVLRLGWVYDDFYHLRYLMTHRPGWYLFDAAGFREFPAKVFTPLLFLSLDVDRRLFGLAPRLFYVHHLVAFALCPAVLYGVLRLWLSRLWAAVAAWIFLMGPVIASLAPLLMVRHYVEAILLAALSVAAWARDRPRISAVLYFAACMAKEIAVPLVVLLPLLPSLGGNRIRRALPHGLALVLYLGLRYAALGTLAGGYGFAADLPALALSLPGKITSELAGGRFSWAAVVLGALIVAGILALRRRALLALFALLLAVLPVLPVSTQMEPRYAVPAWIVLAIAFAAGCQAIPNRKVAITLAAVACLAGLWLNRQDWSLRFARVERMSAENRFLLEMSGNDVLRQPATLAASLKEIEWMRRNVFHRPPGGRWFQDDLYLCFHALQGRIWAYDPAARRMVDQTARIPSLKKQYCSAVHPGAPLQASFRVENGNLFWDLGPYEEGRYRFLLGDGIEAFEMPRSAGFQVSGLTALPLRIEYESPAGWTTHSPELRLEIHEGAVLDWSRP